MLLPVVGAKDWEGRGKLGAFGHLVGLLNLNLLNYNLHPCKLSIVQNVLSHLLSSSSVNLCDVGIECPHDFSQ